MNIIKNSKDVESLPNASLCLYEDTDNHISIILKEKRIKGIEKLEVRCFNKIENTTIIVKVNDEMSYEDSIEKVLDNEKILRILNEMKSINVIHFSNDLDKQAIIYTKILREDKI